VRIGHVHLKVADLERALRFDAVSEPRKLRRSGSPDPDTELTPVPV
jgi:hypothetical protein